MTRSPPLMIVLTIAALPITGCGDTAPTESGAANDRSSRAASFASAPNTWAERAPMPGHFWRFDVAAGTATNAAGQSIVHVLGGRFSTQGEPNMATTILAYNVATNTWTTKAT